MLIQIKNLTLFYILDEVSFRVTFEECVIGFDIIYQQFIVMYDSGCQICCNWSRLKQVFNVLTHWSTMPLINMIPHPVT